MDFLKKMKSRDYIEMGIKTAIVFLFAIIFVFVMENMIYGLRVDFLQANKVSGLQPSAYVAYCEEVNEDTYTVYLKDKATGKWIGIHSTQLSKQRINEMFNQITWHKPNTFELGVITPTHYIVITVFLGGVLAFYGWRFNNIKKEYKKYERKFKRTGKLPI